MYFHLQKLSQQKPKQPQGARLTKRPIASSAAASGTTKKSASAIAAAQKREAQRKQLIEMKRKHKMAASATANTASEDIIGDETSAPAQHPSIQPSNNEENNTENETDR